MRVFAWASACVGECMHRRARAWASTCVGERVRGRARARARARVSSRGSRAKLASRSGQRRWQRHRQRRAREDVGKRGRRCGRSGRVRARCVDERACVRMCVRARVSVRRRRAGGSGAAAGAQAMILTVFWLVRTTRSNAAELQALFLECCAFFFWLHIVESSLTSYSEGGHFRTRVDAPKKSST